MSRLRITPLAAMLVWLWGCAPVLAEATTPDFGEVYSLIREHLTGVDEAELNRTAVNALVSALQPRVSLVGGGGSSDSVADEPLVAKSTLFDGSIAYLRIGRVDGGLDRALREAFKKTVESNKLHGLVLDLRFVSGQDYRAASSAVDIFVKKERPLLDWGEGMVRSTDKVDAISLPVAVLVNRQTSGSPEAMAALLRDAGVALILGARTAGNAVVAREFALKQGQRLRIATGPVQMGGGAVVPVQGLRPDILVEVAPQDERAYYADAYREIPRTNASAGFAGNAGTSTNRVRRPRFSEAELVRERREGFNPDLDAAGDELEKPVVRDPALARALDVLKGLALVRPARS